MGALRPARTSPSFRYAGRKSCPHMEMLDTSIPSSVTIAETMGIFRFDLGLPRAISGTIYGTYLKTYGTTLRSDRANDLLARSRVPGCASARGPWHDPPSLRRCLGKPTETVWSRPQEYASDRAKNLVHIHTRWRDETDILGGTTGYRRIWACR